MNKKKLTIQDSSLAFFAGFILCQIAVVAFMCIALVFANLFKIDTTNFSLFFNTAVGYLLCTLVMDVTMFFVFFFFQKKADNPIVQKPTLKKSLTYIAIAILSFFALYPIIVCIDSLLIKFNFKLNTLSYELTTANYFISILSLVILPAICEELLFRGLILKGLKPYGKIFSILLSSIMFSLFHMSLDQTVYPLIMGLLFSVIMYYENNILYTIFMHMINNFLSLTFSYLNINLVFSHWSYILLAVILLCISLTILLYFVIKNNKNSANQKPSKHEALFLIIILLVLLVIWIATNVSKFL